MKLSPEEFKKLALLSRLEIDETQLESVNQQMNDILSYMELIGQVDIEGVEATAHAVALRNVMREDVPQESLSNEEALLNAPEKEGNYFKVPKVMQG